MSRREVSLAGTGPVYGVPYLGVPYLESRVQIDGPELQWLFPPTQALVWSRFVHQQRVADEERRH